MERGVKPITAKRTIGLLDVCRPSLSFLICYLISIFCAATGTSIHVLLILHTARDGSDVPFAGYAHPSYPEVYSQTRGCCFYPPSPLTFLQLAMWEDSYTNICYSSQILL